MLYPLPSSPLSAEFLRRTNRFLVETICEGRPVYAHLANSGRLQSILVPGRSCWLLPQQGANRMTKYDLLAVDTDFGSILTDAHLPNTLVLAACEQALIPEFNCYAKVKPEYRFGRSRLDFAFFDADGKLQCLLEVKSAADFQLNAASFPDAPSPRAVKHLQELTAAAEKGLPVYVIFLAQLAWARSISLNAEVDPGFVHAVRQAQSAGVHLLGYTVYPRLPDGIDWGVSVPVEVPYLK